MKSAILALVLIGAAFATQADVIAQIKRIDSTQFGRTLFDTVYLQLEAGEPLDRLLGTLAELEERYMQEQKEDDVEHQEFQQVCNADISAYDKDLAESTTQKIVLEAKLEGELYPKRDIISTIVKQKQKELNELTLELSEIDTTREEEAAEFEEVVREHEEATAIITECRRLFTDNLQAPAGEEAFVQRTRKVHPQARLSEEGTSLVQKHLLQGAKRAAKFTHRKSWGKIFKALATITSRIEQVADQSGVQRIVTLCDELLEKIQDSLDLERFAEDKRIEAYKKARNLLTINIQVTEVALANAQVELASVQNQIQQTEASLDNTNQRIEILNEKRGDRYEQCEQEALDYQNARQARTDDRNVVSETIGLVNVNLRTLKEQLAVRLQAGDKFD